MKQLLIIGLAFIVLVSCKKKNTEQEPIIDNRNRSLINIPLAELKSILSGTWLLKKRIDCGIAGCVTTTIANGQEDIFYFLPQDSVKRTNASGTVIVYDKAIISKTNPDNTWYYLMNNGLQSWEFFEIKNDTLLLNSAGLGSRSFLIKKP